VISDPISMMMIKNQGNLITEKMKINLRKSRKERLEKQHQQQPITFSEKREFDDYVCIVIFVMSQLMFTINVFTVLVNG